MDAVKNFVDRWKNHGYEKGEMQPFWMSFLRDVLKVDKPENFINFEVPVKLKHKSFIDAFLPDTKVIIEQKSLSENLTKEKIQSDGEKLTPYEQAQRYITGLPLSMHPRKIIVCNFKEFLIYDMETLDEPEKILLEELPEKFHAFDFMIDATKNQIRIELELSLKAGEIVGKLYDALKAQYINPDSEESLQSLNKLCVRLVFCLYAESTGIFGKRKIFRDYLQGEKNIRRALLDLFEVLNTPEENRDPYIADELKIFPYVNGGLFADEKIEIPNFTPEIKNLLLDEASAGFNWSEISPTIFGAVFESTLNPLTRRVGGMHYTSQENIHKVIDPLFLEALRAEYGHILNSGRGKKKKLLDFREKLASLKFFDPACGSGNFLTESYISLRRLENEVLKELLGSQIQIGEFTDPIKVSIGQFYGIEINDFACTVAKTALWISELQMMTETQEIIHRDLDFLPLKSYANIFEGNALRTDWKKIVPPDLNFIMGNPPFVGGMMMTREQKAEMIEVWGNIKGVGEMDYVSAWYKKAADFIDDKEISCAFVSTNSIVQGQQACTMWKPLMSAGLKINFAHQTFKWDSESIQKAAVHCVIIGFAKCERDEKIIFDGDKKNIVENINSYLLDAPNIFIESRSAPVCEVPAMFFGSMPRDGGGFILSEEEREIFISKNPGSEKFIREYIGANEFINGKKRYCLWLVNANPSELRKCGLIMERINFVKEFRLASKAAATRKFAETPTLFCQIAQPETDYIIVPRVSSERRKYVPIGFLQPEVIASDAVQIIPDATIYHFGILTSSVHMAWVRAVAGRLEMRYRYSKDIVYNNFVWCEPSESQRKKIEQTAQNILDVRAKYPGSSLADLYDATAMPPDLRKAHAENDKAVMSAYGFKTSMTESEIVAELMKLYKSFTDT